MQNIKPDHDKMKLYYSIRVIKAKNYDEAMQKIEDGNFHDSHRLCDKVLTASQVKKEFKVKGGEK